jgi:hypothetical protein
MPKSYERFLVEGFAMSFDLAVTLSKMNGFATKQAKATGEYEAAPGANEARSVPRCANAALLPLYCPS